MISTILAGGLSVKPKFVFTSHSCRMAEVRHSARLFLKKCDFNESSIELLVLGLDEACTQHHPACLRPRRQASSAGDGTSARSGPLYSSRLRAAHAIRKSSAAGHSKTSDRAGSAYTLFGKVFDYVKYEPRRRGTRLVLEKRLTTPEVFSNGER